MTIKNKTDWRDMRHGDIILSDSYADQPYIVTTDDGAWLCTLTTGSGHEGQKGQHVVTLRSLDKGKNWQDIYSLEPANGPESAYSVLLKIPSGRIFAFYAYNSQNIREVPADAGPTFNGVCKRVDCLGDFVFRYSDDHGKSWSEQRYCIDVREMAIDRENVFGGKIRFFWNVGKPFFYANSAFVPLIKVGGFGEGCYTRTEGVLLKCSNIELCDNPDDFVWETLPDGDAGLKTPPDGGMIAEEQSYSVLSDGSFFSVYRSVDGYPVCAYSRDDGHTWSTPEYMAYADGRLIKHPRAANFAWKCTNGKFLYWFHNHGGRFIREMKQDKNYTTGLAINNATPYDDRNPVWLCGGEEIDSPKGRRIQWSQPEIVLYSDDLYVGMSYPDMIEQDGKIFLTETNKHTARIHEISDSLINGLWLQFANNRKFPNKGLVLEQSNIYALPMDVELPVLPDFIGRDMEKGGYVTLHTRQGVSLDLLVCFDSLDGGQILLDNRTDSGRGFCLRTTERKTIEIILNDGGTENRWDCDPDFLTTGFLHHIVVIIDGGPNIISFVIDGKFCDGGDFRQFGWGRLSPNLRNINGRRMLKIGSTVKGHIESLRVYERALRVSEARVK